MQFGSKDTNLYVSNQSGERIYVIPAPNPDWVVADVAVGVTGAVVVTALTWGAGSAAAGGAVASRAMTLTNIVRAINILNIARTAAKGWRSIQDAEDLKEFKQSREAMEASIRQYAVTIEPGEYKKVNDESLLNPLNYLFAAKGWGDLFEGSTMTLFVLSSTMERSVQFNTDSDAAWIVFPDAVARAAPKRIAVTNWDRGFVRYGRAPFLQAGDALLPRQCITSPDGRFELVYQEDGNLELRQRDGATKEWVVWDSNTKGRAPGRVAVQEDGNLVIYGPNGEVHAALNDYGQGESYATRRLHVQDDGNVVLRNQQGAVAWDRLSMGDRLRAK